MDDGRSYDGSGGLWLGRAYDGQVNATVKLIAQSLTTHLFQLFNGTNDTTMKGDSAEPCRVRGFQTSFNPFANSNGRMVVYASRHRFLWNSDIKGVYEVSVSCFSYLELTDPYSVILLVVQFQC